MMLDKYSGLRNYLLPRAIFTSIYGGKYVYFDRMQLPPAFLNEEGLATPATPEGSVLCISCAIGVYVSEGYTMLNSVHYYS